MTRPFTEIANAFRGAKVELDFAASPSLADAILGGAPADVFASADQANMTRLQEAKLVRGNPRTFAHNRLVIVTKPGNPARIASAADLATASTVALCAVEVPCGTYAAQALRSAGVSVDESRVTRSHNVAATVEQVAEGDAVAGIVYFTDAKANADRLGMVLIADTQNVIAPYPIAAIGPKRKAAADRFVEFVAGAQGQRILKKYGFLP